MRPRWFAAALLFALAPALHALDVPPPPTRWLTDRAGILSTTEASILDSKLETFEQQSGAQFIIYTFPSLEGESIEDFTIRCVEKWKVGQKKYDNGLVLFVFVKEKKVRIEVGYGLEGTVTDAFSSRVIREFMAPHFQSGAYGQGLNAAADAIIAKIRGGEAPVPPLQPRGAQSREGGGDVNPFVIVVILFVVFFVVVPMLTRGGRRGSGGCGGCWLPLMLLQGGGSGVTFGGGRFSGGGGFGGFSGGGGGFGGGGATGGW